ncbi:PEP-CTERM-box response regulator transcription factor [Emcibacter nanhaiensis]|uniref:PEP-CTERM-box response regulator transcription factor n=1 Tax=Emcibacter nanhaiensis TaxID=1505037 RepID=A0A501PFV7_9PROT|nr:PEP-CTERM-box response regulator transcription factor [Emcibacter nanhaiensis]TPD59359.1 PEP-CTERM-box response regulator transcription factor [Emcibacter nanhaiensis]
MSDTIKRKLLVVEDDPGLQRQYKWNFEDYDIEIAGTREEALDIVRRDKPAVVTLDLGLPPDEDGISEGLACLEQILAEAPHTKVIIASGHGARESALQSISLGAYDFYQKPVDPDELGLIVERAYRLSDLEEENRRLAAGQQSSRLNNVITASESMNKVCNIVERVAPTNVTVMLLGASGTGKELLARALHDLSDRKEKPFVAINCAAIPENLLESELFGYEKGAFTGAVKQTLGKIEVAHGGTLFLDEIGDLPFPLQVKLLRFLQERVIERIGGRKEIPVDVRVVCATHQDLESHIAENLFREDLFYRLSEIVINIPPLVEREGDAALLAHNFLNKFNKELKRNVKSFTKEAISVISGYNWPGNVRELENRIKRAVIMCEGNKIEASDLELAVDEMEEELLNLKQIREMADMKAIRKALANANGNVSHAAKLLGVSRPTFYGLIKQYNINL